MPKQKTRKAAKKRFRVTATGKVRHRKTGTSHLMTRKSNKRLRQLRKPGFLTTTEAKKVRQMLNV